ncbi:MAG TPA: beta-ketoacyl-[acyl-carrier-protein] synthase family protein, partial [Phycisphaerae bacterium]|nr:beta-ketoacyl-[acyl-carrier-protein] synthase family protein [Phycisphaerae bacterium]
AFNVLTACAASTQAIGEAALQVRRGDADVMLTGGAHSMIHPYGVTGFIRLTALSSRNDDIATASRPFDQTRDGFVLGEGSSILVIETREHARKRGAKVLAEIVGYGSSADAFRVTDQDPDGAGAAASMKMALADAGLAPADIDYISAHGTGTKQNDQVETLAVKSVFGERACKVPISSVKSMLGHLIAAAGATELITCILAIRDQVLPPTINLHHPDPDCDLDCVPNAPRKAVVRTCMSNSFGFGGQNNALIVAAAR